MIVTEPITLAIIGAIVVTIPLIANYLRDRSQSALRSKEKAEDYARQDIINKQVVLTTAKAEEAAILAAELARTTAAHQLVISDLSRATRQATLIATKATLQALQIGDGEKNKEQIKSTEQSIHDQEEQLRAREIANQVVKNNHL